MSCLRHLSLYCTVSLIFSLLGIASGVIRQCEKETSCKCKAGVSWSIDLSPLDVGNPPRYSVAIPVTSTAISNSTIFYHPCQSFWAENETLGQCGKAQGVAVCLVEVFHNSSIPTNYTDLGVQKTSTFSTNGLFPKQDVALTFTSANGEIKTTLKLKCKPDEENGTLILEDAPLPTKSFILILASRYSCANATPAGDSGLSVGSILLILFFILVMVYLSVGMFYNHCIMGATGFEIIPHCEFWIDFPFLVRDGIIFMCKGCKTEPSYDRI